MSSENKKSLGYKIQKSPALLVLIIVAIAVAIFSIAHISSAIGESVKQNADEKAAAQTTEEQAESTEQNDDDNFDYGIKYYSDSVKSAVVEKSENAVSLKIEFKDKSAMLRVNAAQDINSAQAVPVFCLPLKDGTQLKCPGEVRLSENGNTAVYSLSVIDDYANAVALTDEITVDYTNVFENGFSLYLLNKQTGVAECILGTYEESDLSASFDLSHNNYATGTAAGIKTVEITKNDEFVWVDIYYNDAASYMKLNNDFVTNFVRFGVEKNGAEFKRDFITTEYDNLNMVRCKFDSYSLEGLAKEMGLGDITAKELFDTYTVSVWTTDYDTDTPLFKLGQ